MYYVSHKCARQISVLGRETRPPGARYLVGLSFGTSSTVLLHVLNKYAESILSKGRREPFQLSIVHVDTTVSEEGAPQESAQISQIIDRYAQRYPLFKIERIPLAAAIGLRTIDWSALPSLKTDAEPAEQLRDVFERLPSTTSRADLLRLFIRHILISAALRQSCQAVLLGHSTTALAELTLAETAKGRGYSLPWQINDGVFPVQDYATTDEREGASATPTSLGESVRIHYPLREVFRKELSTFITLTDPPLTEIIPRELEKTSSVVSHKHLSIEEVMSRYFEGVEENYPSVVANVVRTTAKLDRLGAGERCGVCGMPLDEQGNERWRGEIGDIGEGSSQHPPNSSLCYGCQRSIHN